MERKDDRLVEMDLRTLRSLCMGSKVPMLQTAMKACSKFLNIVQQVSSLAEWLGAVLNAPLGLQRFYGRAE